MRKNEPKIVIDMELMVKYAKLQEYYKKLWDDYVDACEEVNRLRGKLRMQKYREEHLPYFPEV